MEPHSQPQVGRYTLYGKIASGGMATVHFGRLLGGAGFSRTVAIKRLHPHMAGEPEFVSTLIDEARLAARIHHPNVVPTLDVVATEGELLVVMEYVRGESLGRLLKAGVQRGGHIPLPIASAIAMGALQGLHAAHEATSDQGVPLGIVHRDVSPQNILVGVDGVARIIDFGVAKAVGRLQTTREGELKGKTAYMSPEQLQEGVPTRASDVYAMSIVLWEVLANRRLFFGDNDAVVYGKALAGAKEPPSRYMPGLPDGIDALVMKGLERDPARRFTSAMEMAEALVRIVPPALGMEVGAWVEQMAGSALAQRAAALAEIESSSGMTAPAASSGRVSEAPALKEATFAGSDEVATITSQSASLSVKTPAPDGVPRGRRGWVGLLAAASLVGAAGVVALVWRSSAPSVPARSEASSPTPSASSAQPPARESNTGPSASGATATGPSAPPSASSTAAASVTPPPSARAVRPTAPRKAAPPKGPADTVEASGF